MRLKLLRRLALALILICGGAESALADQIEIRRHVTVRAAPLRASEPLDFPEIGERLELLDEGRQESGYYHVRLRDGRDGWVYRSFVRRIPEEALIPAAPPPDLEARRLTLHFINVGQGDSTLITCPNGTTLLIDAGSLSHLPAQPIRDYVTERIAPLGGDIDHLIVSHPDADHFNLLPAVIGQTPVRRAYYVGNRADYSDPNVFDWLQSKPERALKLSPEDHDREATPNAAIDCGAADVWILAAAVRASASPKNAMSIVVMVRMGDFEAVITGDATHATEETILSRYTRPWLDVDVLRVGHHGSLATSTSVTWANTLTPETAIVSAGFQNTFGHPRAEVVARLVPHTKAAPPHRFRDAVRAGSGYRFTDHAAFREAVYSTATSGTIVITTTGQGYQLTAN